MDLFDSFMPEVARTILQTLGSEATLTSVTNTYNSVTGTNTPTTSTYTCLASPPSAFKRNLIDGTTIQEGDLNSVVGGAGITVDPKATDTLTIGARTFRVIGVQPIKTGQLTACYKLHLREAL